jgi:lipopolysaccharide biosynthesis glycosyltransferase
MPARTRPTPRRVVCAIDSQMVYGLVVAMSSLVSTSREPLTLTIGYLEGTLSEDDRRYLSAVMEHLGIPHDFANLASDPRFITQGHISPTTFAKFLLADSHPEAHLWIDADTAALPGWDDIFLAIDSATPDQGLVVAERGEGAGGLAFNAGVLGWPEGSRRDWSSHLNELDLVDTQEQYLFNVLYAPSALRVSERFNLLTYRIDRVSSIEPPFIIHFAGAHKPWHMPRHYVQRCAAYGCPWSMWFAAETTLLSGMQGSHVLAETESRRDQALRSGTLRWRRDHRGLMFLRLVRALGPLGVPLVAVMSSLARFVPRGTHPVH